MYFFSFYSFIYSIIFQNLSMLVNVLVVNSPAALCSRVCVHSVLLTGPDIDAMVGSMLCCHSAVKTILFYACVWSWVSVPGWKHQSQIIGYNRGVTEHFISHGILQMTVLLFCSIGVN